MTVDLQPLFEPAGVVVAGASTHPGKFGFATLHNILTCGYQGNVFATNRGVTPDTPVEILGIDCLPSVRTVPDGQADLVYVCVPAPAVPDVLRDAAAVGIRAAFIASAGFGEGDDADGAAIGAEIVKIAAELNLAIAGPNGQGLVSTPASLCAQFVAPWPRRGGISIVSQSGNLASGAMNHADAGGVGVARAVSAGNSLCLGVDDYIAWYGADDETQSIIAYVEGVGDARRFYDVLAETSRSKPVVVVKGGSSSEGAKAAASHTGSLATDDRIFDGLLRQAGAWRAPDVGAAFGAAAALGVHGHMRGPNVAVLTNAGGWGVLTADALEPSLVDLMTLPDDLHAQLDEIMPPRWSASNPVDVAGGETRDTIPAALSVLAEHDEVDAVLLLGLGIQSNTASLFRAGRFADEPDIERICAFHERQDRLYAQTVVDVSAATGTPILAATELAIADPANPGPATLRENGHPCYASPRDAVAALSALYARGRFLGALR
jgi:acetyltransferase